MAPTMTHFPVGNGDMTLMKLENDVTVLVDMNIAQATISICDVVPKLKARLAKDASGRHYVDLLIVTHPDEDHCRGIQENFYLGNPIEYPDRSNKIFIKEIWCSPIVYRRECTDNPLSESAKALNGEAKRRGSLCKNANWESINDGNRVKFLGEDDFGYMKDLSSIHHKTKSTLCNISGLEAYVIGPLSKTDIEEDKYKKNNTSLILQMKIKSGTNHAACKFLIGGDSEVEVWEAVWKAYKGDKDRLKHDILLAPHHCSWRSISKDSSSKNNAPKVCDDAISALSQTESYSRIVSSSQTIKDNDSDPPSHRAMERYKEIASYFYCTNESYESDNKILEFIISAEGPRKKISDTVGAASGNAVVGQTYSHG